MSNFLLLSTRPRLVVNAVRVCLAGGLLGLIVFDLSAAEDITTGTAGTTSFDFDFVYNYSNPATGEQQIIEDASSPENVYRIFVGVRTLGGSTLGFGGAGGTGFAGSGTLGSGSLADAVADAEANDTHRRGGGPLVITLNGAFEDGTPFSFEVGLGVGSVVFDDDANWHFDHTVPVAPEANDFYSVCLLYTSPSPRD